jgi:hypothetical protein
MKLSLSIFKRNELNDYSRRDYIKFAVVDLETSKEYPANFVCILPRDVRSTGKNPTNFERKFGDKSLELARKLLKRALRVERDREVKVEIRERLNLLEPKP